MRCSLLFFIVGITDLIRCALRCATSKRSCMAVTSGTSESSHPVPRGENFVGSKTRLLPISSPIGLICLRDIVPSTYFLCIIDNQCSSPLRNSSSTCESGHSSARIMSSSK